MTRCILVTSLVLASSFIAPTIAAQTGGGGTGGWCGVGVGGADGAGGGSWVLEVPSDGSEPTARHEAAYVEVGGLFYLMGGRGQRPVDRYDPGAQTWTDLGLPPQSIHHFQPVGLGGKVWVIGAFEGSYPNETPIPDIWTYDPALNSWTTGSAIPPARNRGSAGAVTHQDRVYVVGGNTLGHNGGYVPWFDCYDPVLDTWTVLPDAPHARDHFTAAVVGNKLIAAGGRRTDLPVAQDKTVGAVDVYDFSTGSWSSFPAPIPTERAGTMAVARDEHVIIVGGETPGQAHAETEALDVGTGEWTTLPDLIDSRHSGGTVLWQDAIYCASGAGQQGGSPELTTQERLDLGGLLAPSPTNLLANADFDNALASWEDMGGLTLSVEGSIAPPSLDVQNGWAGQTVSGAASETYTLKGVYQVSGTTGDVTLALDFLDLGAVKIGESALLVGPTAGGFTSFSFNGTTPVGTTSIRARFEAAGDRTLSLDDVVLMETPSVIPRLGVPVNAWALSSTAEPAGGQVFDPVLDHTSFVPDATTDVLMIGFAPINVAAGPGTLLVDLTASFLLFGSPGSPFLLPVLVDPTTVGVPVYLQGASIAPGVRALSNALDVTIQAP